MHDCCVTGQDFDEGVGRFGEGLDVAIGEAMQIDPQAKELQTGPESELVSRSGWDAVRQHVWIA